ncbi:MAG: phosphomannomutase, partial [Deltaproteobacteria bacterium]
IMYDEIQRLGGNAIMWKTGHSLIKSKMKETGAVLAGEMSGHIFFADRYFGYDDAIYASCRLIEILARRRAERPDTTVSSLLANIPKMYSTAEIRVDCPDEKKFKVVERLYGIFDELKKNPELGIVDIITIDGLRIVFKDGWALVRASNTQPALVTRYEAVTEKRLQEIKDKMDKIGTDTIFR